MASIPSISVTQPSVRGTGLSSARLVRALLVARRNIAPAVTCYFSNSRRVNTAFCPCGVRSPGVCPASATQVLDHVPSSPAESYRVSLPD